MQFTLEDVHARPDRLWERGVWEYVIQPDGLSGPGWVHLSVAAREQLGDRDRQWIVDHLNLMASRTSYGVVPDPPASVGPGIA